MKPFNMLCGLLEVADGLLSVLSLGNIHKGFVFKFAGWHLMRELRKKMETKNG